jgi:signal transduction histidine kinase
LIDNALRHNLPDGHVWISTEVRQGQAAVSVSNTGPVVPPGEVERLFGPFQRLGRDRVGRAEGHGLGLAIVAAIAGAHGARLTAAARPDGGLTITVTFATH